MIVQIASINFVEVQFEESICLISHHNLCFVKFKKKQRFIIASGISWLIAI